MVSPVRCAVEMCLCPAWVLGAHGADLGRGSLRAHQGTELQVRSPRESRKHREERGAADRRKAHSSGCSPRTRTLQNRAAGLVSGWQRGKAGSTKSRFVLLLPKQPGCSPITSPQHFSSSDLSAPPQSRVSWVLSSPQTLNPSSGYSLFLAFCLSPDPRPTHLQPQLWAQCAALSGL